MLLLIISTLISTSNQHNMTILRTVFCDTKTNNFKTQEKSPG